MEGAGAGAGFCYDAFISYHPVGPDRAIAERLGRSLLSYRAPKSAARLVTTRRLTGIYLDRERPVPAGSPDEESLEALRRSRFLIVVCSPRTPASELVAGRIRGFVELGRGDRILTLLIEGEPRESFPAVLLEPRRAPVQGDDHPSDEAEPVEPLAADVRDRRLRSSPRLLSRERLRLLAPILGCRFDDLRQREHERFVRHWSVVAALAIAAASVFAATSFYQWQQAESQERVAAEQRRQAEEAYLRLTRELPERFKEVPQAVPAIRQVLEENRARLDELRTGREDPLEFFDDLLERDSVTQKRSPAPSDGP